MFKPALFLLTSIIASVSLATSAEATPSEILFKKPIQLERYESFFETWQIQFSIDASNPTVIKAEDYDSGCLLHLEYPEKVFPAGTYKIVSDDTTAPGWMSYAWKRLLIHVPDGYYDENPNPPKRVVVQIVCDREHLPVTDTFVNDLFRPLNVELK